MIKWGIIGPGAIANAFAKEVNNSQGGKVVAVFGRNEERAKSFSEKYNIEKYYSDINEFLNDNVNAHISKILPLTADFNIAVIEF